MSLSEFYLTVWRGSFRDNADELSRLLSRAEDVVNSSIFLSGYTVETAPESVSTAVYKAVCAQADYIEACGGAEAISEGGMTSASLGKFSYSCGSRYMAGDGSAVSPAVLCKLAASLLVPTGLLYRGVAAL